MPNKPLLKISWFILIPLAGLILAYTLLVSPNRFARCLPALFEIYAHFPNTATDEIVPAYTSGNSTRLLTNGNTILPEMLRIIDQAEDTIRLQVMLFIPDDAGQTLADALITAAQRGAQVQLTFDINQSINGGVVSLFPSENKDLYSQRMQTMLAEMRAAGIIVLDNRISNSHRNNQMSTAARLRHDALMDSICIDWMHVDHRKLLLVDDEIAIMGGVNIGNEYLYFIAPDLSLDSIAEVEQRQSSGAAEAWEKWQDCAVIVSGPALRELAHQFNLSWDALGGTVLNPEVKHYAADGTSSIQVLTQAPGTTEISRAMIHLIDNAESEIYLAYPYISHNTLLHHLEMASARGVVVKFIFPGDHNDVSLSRRFNRLFTAELLQSGVVVFENNMRMNHTKIIVVDNRFVVIGSANFNYRSIEHDLELNLLIEDENLAGEVIQQIFHPYIEQAEELHEPYPLRWRLIDHLLLPFS